MKHIRNSKSVLKSLSYFNDNKTKTGRRISRYYNKIRPRRSDKKKPHRDFQMGKRIIRNLFEGEIPKVSLPILRDESIEMNYVAYAMYKHTLRNLPYIDAQNFCMKVIAHQPERLVMSLKHAVRMQRPDLLWWFEAMLSASKAGM